MRPLTELETRYVGVDLPSCFAPREQPGQPGPAASIWTLRRRAALFLQTTRNDEARQK